MLGKRTGRKRERRGAHQREENGQRWLGWPAGARRITAALRRQFSVLARVERRREEKKWGKGRAARARALSTWNRGTGVRRWGTWERLGRFAAPVSISAKGEEAVGGERADRRAQLVSGWERGREKEWPARPWPRRRERGSARLGPEGRKEKGEEGRKVFFFFLFFQNHFQTHFSNGIWIQNSFVQTHTSQK